MSKKETAGGVALMLIGLGLQILAPVNVLVGSGLIFSGLVLLVVSCRKWIFGSRPTTVSLGIGSGTAVIAPGPIKNSAVIDSTDPIIALEFTINNLNSRSLAERGFMRLRNIGGRAAEAIQVVPLVHGVWRIEFEEIPALAPSGHGGHVSDLHYTAFKSGQYFSSSDTGDSPEHGIVTFLSEFGIVVRLPLTIQYRVGRRIHYAVREIVYDNVLNTLAARRGSSVPGHYRAVPLIEQLPSAEALNLGITNLSDYSLDENKLILHSVTTWNEQACKFRELGSFIGFKAVTMYGNATGLPSWDKRWFQLVEFTDPASPFIRAKDESAGIPKEWHLPLFGLWRMELELRWKDGIPYRFEQCFRWDSTSAPRFVECMAHDSIHRL